MGNPQIPLVRQVGPFGRASSEDGMAGKLLGLLVMGVLLFVDQGTPLGGTAGGIGPASAGMLEYFTGIQ